MTASYTVKRNEKLHVLVAWLRRAWGYDEEEWQARKAMPYVMLARTASRLAVLDQRKARRGREGMGSLTKFLHPCSRIKLAIA